MHDTPANLPNQFQLNREHPVVWSFLLCGVLGWVLGCQSPSSSTSSAADRAEDTPIPAKNPANEIEAPAEAKSLTDVFTGDSPWPLFNGQDLTGWEEADYVGKGEVSVENGEIHLGRGYMTGLRWTNAVIRMNYEVSYEAMRVDGTDFFCGFTFPVNDDYCTFIAGGWGGGVIGLSSINGMDASSNDTTKYLNFENGRWFKMRVRVTPEKIEAWIDDEQMVDQSIVDQELSIRIEMEACVPMGFATWSTTGALRNVILKKL